MATSRFQTTQYTAESFVESAGAVLFHRSTRRICLTQHRDEWLLAKGRRNVGETSPQTAIREATEETGFSCQLLPVTMTTRAPPAVELGSYPDEPRIHSQVCEPFMITCRLLDSSQLKLITWYIAEIDENVSRTEGEKTFNVELFEFENSLETLTYQSDRDIVRTAISLFDANYMAHDCPSPLQSIPADVG